MPGTAVAGGGGVGVATGLGIGTPGLGAAITGRTCATAVAAGSNMAPPNKIKDLRRKLIGRTNPFIFKDILPSRMHTHDERGSPVTPGPQWARKLTFDGLDNQTLSWRPIGSASVSCEEHNHVASDFTLDGGMIPRNAQRIIDERAEPRRPAASSTAVIEFRGRKHVVRLVNVSGSGAMATFPYVPHIGEKLSVQLLDCGQVVAQVRWVKDGRIGLSFTTPMD